MKMTPPENALSAKLSGTKISEDELKRRLAAADQQISNVAARFTDWVGADVAAAQAALGRLEKDPEDGQALQEIFRVAHDIKGQAGTFGYALATKVADLLCDFIRSTDAVPSPEQTTVIKAHLAALHFILSQDIKGDGDQASQELVKKLATAASRVSPVS